ncbi:asparagine synthase (glutamine-hydrolyzing) [Nitrospira sp. Nam74]
MCGIAGILDLDGHVSTDSSHIKRMADAMVHRGPDDEGFFVSGPVHLAHRRLSIIDLNTGQQPMFNEDNSIVVVFNGEIYNHRQLRNVLEAKGHIFRTHSDTECILHAYEQFGNNFESHLTGMFAFALWDIRRRRLVLSRDRLGIKPLYYTVHHGQLIFASEIKAILTIKEIERRVDHDGLDAYLSLRYVPGPRTMFKDIYKLEPAHTMIAQEGTITTRAYWELTFEENHRDERQAAQELEALVSEVCHDHLMSEVPYGVFLSGGVDSSAVVAVLQKTLSDKLRTFTVGYEHAEGINEFDYAESVSRHIGTVHHKLTLQAQDFANWIPKLVWHLDEPVGDAACIPLYFLAKYAKERATVLQSGEGADEIFAGYSIYKKMEFMNRLQTGILSPLLRAGSQTVAPRAGGGKLARYLRLFGKPLEQRYHGVSGHFMEGIREKLIKPGIFRADNKETFAEKTFSQYYDRVSTDHDLNRMLFIDTKTWLPDDLLVKADKMTMAASVELRVPFLDHRLVEFAARLPISLKIQKGESKYLLKKIMEPYLPRDVIYRTKAGFPVPVSEWFKNGLKDLATGMLLNPKSAVSNYLDAGVIRGLLQEHKSGAGDYANELWGLLILESWFHEFRVQV